MRATGRVPAEALRDLLEAAPRANIAFRSGDAIQAMPVAFRFRAGRYWIGVPRTQPEPRLGRGEVVKLLIDDGRWFFELRGPLGPRDTVTAEQAIDRAAWRCCVRDDRLRPARLPG